MLENKIVRKMQILVLNYEFPPLGGGASPITLDICKQLVMRNHEVDVVTMGFDLQGKKAYGKETVKVGDKEFNVYRVKCSRKHFEKADIFDMVSYIFPAYKVVDELVKSGKRYDICHCHFIIPTGVVAYYVNQRHHIPYIITSHGSDIPNYNPDRFKVMHQLVQPVWKMVVNRAHYITTPSERLRRLILSQNLRLKPKVVVVPNGIEEKPNELLKKKPIILYAGRLFKRKGVDHLIRAFKSLKSDWELHIAGAGDELESLKTLAGDNPHIKFLGWVNKADLIKEYKQSEIFCLPSSEESFGMAILEAMSYQNAIITTPACVEVSGVGNGIFVDYGDVSDLAKQIRFLVETEDIRRIAQNKSLVRASEFYWGNILPNYEKYFSAVVRQGLWK